MRIDPAVLPPAHERRKADDAVDEVLSVLEEEADRAVAGSEAGRALIRSLAGNSAFLARVITTHAPMLVQILKNEPDTLVDGIHSSLREDAETADSADALMRLLRVAKGRIALLAAAADIAGNWSLEEVTNALSRFAELTVELALARAVYDRIRRGDLDAPEDVSDTPAPGLLEGTGLFVLGMGKLGARELNYSSDIDLIVLYDDEIVTTTGKRTVSDCMIRVTQEMVRILDTRTGDGYVFRTDLRLRPDPVATPVALSVSAAETYYQSVAQTWERAAMIKARTIAGDKAAGEAYLARLAPFVWRRSLDFAAIEDVHALKDQIHRHHRHQGTQAAGFDVKLGPGGIRTIEFFVQLNQLIAGGRDESLRAPGTLEALDRLVEAGWIVTAARDELAEAYRFLRRLEHRLQMREDRQTHEIPRDEGEREAVAGFMGFASREAFEADLRELLQRVQARYAELLPRDEAEAGELGDEALEARFERGGFSDIANAMAIVERWRRGRYRALRTERARKHLDACLGRLVDAFGETAEPNAALARFDGFLSALPAGVQLFATFHSNPWLFELIARIMGTAPALADSMAKRPQLIDAVMEQDFFEPLPDKSGLAAELEIALRRARDYQDVLDMARRWTDERRFQLGVQTLEAVTDIREASEAMTNLAEVTIDELLPRVEAEYAERYGRFPDGRLGVVAMGKFGGRELSFGSDLDIVLLYEVTGKAEQSDGERAVGPSRYFSGLGQALITALTAMTSEGRLWEVDTRLRPSGRAGPLVVTLETFSNYYAHTAWTWEHMALTRARVVTAPADFAHRIDATIGRTLTFERDEASLLPAVARMRERMAREFATDTPWNVKHARGGLVDLEFIVQYLLLREGARAPSVFQPRLDDCIDRLQTAQSLDTDDATTLKAAHRLFHALQSLLRLTTTGEPDTARFTPDLRRALARAGGADSFEALERSLLDAEADVRHVYERVISGPAALVTPPGPG